MSPRSVVDVVLHDAPVLPATTPVEEAARALLDGDLPALPVADDEGRYLGIFGEREFIQAVFPGYLGTLGSVAFVPQSLEEVLDKRRACASEPIRRHLNTEHVDVPVDSADIQVAETFIHHRVLLVPVTDAGRVVGVITRRAFFTALAERFLSS
ncbi:MAG: CBS domain-containing protein [Actinomycetota bacterium]|nr:CBS domain-containing protein [Actinomycetota bacterium]